jgi:flagellum-specific ATP synthase
MLSNLNKCDSIIENIGKFDAVYMDGKVIQVVGLVIEATLPEGKVGELCEIYPPSGRPVRAEVVGFIEDRGLLMPLDDVTGISPGSRVRRSSRPLTVPVGHQLFGRILDGLGNPIDGKGPIRSETIRSVFNVPPNPLKRIRITDVVSTGIRSIDGLLTLGKGQRIGIFSGSGVGKSVLLGMIAKYTNAEVNVIGLIGERGREVREFIERDLGPEGLSRSIVVVATSDQASMVRIKAALITTAIAEYFRELGLNVMLMMDSLTRVGMAQREIGLATGEPPTTKGYTPSVFSFLPRLLERAGNSELGSITGLYTVLVESDDMDDPIADAARSILDGHIVLSRKLANRGHYPAVDVLESVSRLKNDIITPDHLQKARDLLDLIAQYRESEDLISIGAYAKGTNPKVDEAIDKLDSINEFLRQGMDVSSDFGKTCQQLTNVLETE